MPISPVSRAQMLAESACPVVIKHAKGRAEHHCGTRDWKNVAAAMACVALAACGGGASGGVQSASVQPPPPAPPPPPPPPPTNFDTAEFRRADGPQFHLADDAWREGATGMGEVIAVIDTGIDSDSPEFAGRIHAASRDLAGNRGIDPVDDHGSNVARVAAGARDGEGVLGIAFDAQVLALRGDMPGSCGTDTPQDASMNCLFTDSAIATGIDVAIDNNATVINLSLGGGLPSDELREAVARAADAGIVVVISAGNAGDGNDPQVDPTQPDPFARSLRNAGAGNVIIVGSVDENGDFSEFSNQAGELAGSFLSARGERVCCVYADGEVFVEEIDGEQFVTQFSGTSFAAPQVAGAVALLAQAFPNLTGQEIVEILLTSARDAGDAGTDAVYGTGILDIAQAFQPQGATSFAGTNVAFKPVADFALGSAAMGDALANAALPTTITDRFDRAFTVDLADRARSAAPIPRLRGAVERRGISSAAASQDLALAVTLDDSARAAGLGWSEPLQLTAEDARGAQVLAARVAARIARETQIGFAFAQSSGGLVAQMRRADHGVSGKGAALRPAFLVAPEGGADTGFAQSTDIAFAFRQGIGAWGISLAGERGRAWLGDMRQTSDALPGLRERRTTAQYTLAADRQWRAGEASVSLTILSEDQTVLGAYFNPDLGVTGGDTMFLDARLARRIGSALTLGASYRAGVTRPRGNGFLGDGSRLTTRGWSLDISRNGMFQRGDSLGLRFSQPLRVTGGAVHFDLPIGYDYASESARFGQRSLSLAPEGREIMGELNWRGDIAGAQVSSSVYFRSEPGHFQDAGDDMGAVISVGTSF